MKKCMLVILVIIFMVCIISSTVAEEKEITFRGIPWGSSIEETLNMLKEDLGEEISWKTKVFTDYDSERKFLEDPDLLKVSRNFGVKICVTVPNLKVAGFEVKNFTRKNRLVKDGNEDYVEYLSSDNIILYFSPVLNEDGISYTTEEGSLFRAEYAGFVPEDGMKPWDMKQELSDKLTTLYGKAEKMRSGSQKSSIWKIGDNSLYLVPAWGKNYDQYRAAIRGDGHENILLTSYMIYTSNINEEEYNQIMSIKRWAEQEQKENEQKKEQEEKQKERNERGSDGL